MKKNIYITNPLPEGKNGLTSRANYVQRKKYNFVLSNLQATSYIDENYIDFRNLYNNFCKIDENGEPINISESILKNVNDDIYAVNFVVDAFNELKLLCANSNNIKNEKFKKLKAKKGWSNLHKKYHNHLKIIFDEFIKKINKNYKNNNIINFENFILEFVKHLDNVIYKTPFLKSSYVLSREYPESDAGFSIEFDTGDAGDDKKKISEFILDYEYGEFVKLCKKTNFLIDKNCPWRLVFNPFSEKSEEYMKTYNINKNNLIKNNFYYTKEFDLENLKNYMIIFYNTFVEQKPTAYNVKIVTKNEKQFLSRNFVDRQKLTTEQVNSKFSDNFWFNIYCHLSFVENKLNFTHQQYQIVLKNMDRNFSLYGLQRSLGELTKLINNTEKSVTRGEYNFTLPSAS